MKKYVCIFILFCFGCNELKEGNVISKEFEPAYETVVMLPITIYNGKTTSILMIPYFITHNDSWTITISGKAKNGKILKEKYYIDKGMYDTVKHGDFFCVEGLCSEDTATHKTEVH